MAGSVNKVIIIGNLGADPEIKSFQNGGKIANLRVATSESWKAKDTGERKEKTEWHSVVIQNEGLVGVAEKYLKKGSKCYFEGKLQTRRWQDQSGQDRYSTEIVLQGPQAILTMLDSAPQGQRQQQQREETTTYYGEQGGNGGPGKFSDDLSDDIPFATNEGIW